MATQKRSNFSIIKESKYYFIQCDETKELMSGKIGSLKKAKKYLLDHVNTINFVEILESMSTDEVARRIKLFKGRLRTKQKLWTIEEARLIAKTYTSRGEIYNKNPKLYSTAYARGWLNDICAHMGPSRKRNKFVQGVLNPNKAMADLFECLKYSDFREKFSGAYGVLQRYGVDTQELFENKDNAAYIKDVIRQLADDSFQKFAEMN